MGSFWFEYDENGQSRTFSFDGDNISIGRDQSQDFVLDHPTVSRQHAVVIDEGGGEFRLVVLSKGGLTAVDGERVEGEARLYDGTQLHFGKLAFEFRSDQAPAKPTGGGSESAHLSPGRGGSDGRSTGGASSSATGGGSGVRHSSSTVTSSERAGIETWDEIARSAEEDEDPRAEMRRDSTDGSGTFDGNPEAATTDAPGVGGGDEEETNPVVVVVGLIGIVGLLAYSFWPQGGGGGGPAGNPLEQEDPKELVQVECLSEKKCLKEAKASYRVGREYLEKQDSEVANLFKGYKRLLESEAYLEQADTASAPEELSDLETRIEEARQKLDRIFRNYQVKFRSAQKNDQPREMADALQTIQRYFPDKRAPEYEWANERILHMKKKGTYPSNF